MRIVETQVFKYSELSESAKSAARDWWRTAGADDNYFSESIIEDAQRIAEIIGVSFDTRRGSKAEPAIYWSGFCSQGDGASFSGEWSYSKGSTRAIRDYAPLDSELHKIADALQRAARVSFYRCSARVTVSGHYSHSGTMSAEWYECSDSAGEDIEQALRDFADWIYRALEAEYDYSMSDDTVAENIECNEYEFTEEGARA